MAFRPSGTSKMNPFSQEYLSHGQDYFLFDNQIPIDLTSSIIIPQKDMSQQSDSSFNPPEQRESNNIKEFADSSLSELSYGELVNLFQALENDKEADSINNHIAKLRESVSMRKSMMASKRLNQDNKATIKEKKPERGVINLRSPSNPDGPKILPFANQPIPRTNAARGRDPEENKGSSGNGEPNPDRKVYLAKIKEKLENFDTSQLHYKKDGTLDRRYNTSKEYLRLLDMVGEKEEVRPVPVSVQVQAPQNHVPTDNRRVLIENARAELEKFDKSTLVYTKKKELDKRYNVNKRYIELLEQAHLGR